MRRIFIFVKHKVANCRMVSAKNCSEETWQQFLEKLQMPFLVFGEVEPSARNLRDRVVANAHSENEPSDG